MLPKVLKILLEGKWITQQEEGSDEQWVRWVVSFYLAAATSSLPGPKLFY